MCYSAQVETDYRKYVKLFGATMSLKEFFRVFWLREAEGKLKLPKGMEAPFLEPQSDEEREIKALIDRYTTAQASKLEQEVFAQRRRLADAERALAVKLTKTATESKRIATDKIDRAMARLADLKRTEAKSADSRIYPGYYAPVMVWEEGCTVVLPMRYQCRPEGKPAFYDTKYPGTYNARRDNLQGFWKDLFGYRHGVMIVNAFFENVSRTGPEGEAHNEVLEFRPQPHQDMLVACLWSRWKGRDNEPDLLSFAAITDEPPAEVAAAGHDRCIVPIKPENVDAWLRPDPKNVGAQFAILDERERPYYEHRLAA